MSNYFRIFCYVQANPGSVGFYRVQYSSTMSSSVVRTIHSLSARDRLGVLNDTFSFVSIWLSDCPRLMCECEPCYRQFEMLSIPSSLWLSILVSILCWRLSNHQLRAFLAKGPKTRKVKSKVPLGIISGRDKKLLLDLVPFA